MSKLKPTTSTTLIALLAMAIGGCGDGRSATANPGKAPRGHSREIALYLTPPETQYTGEGKRVVRKVDVIRFFSPFGVSPGEVISRQQPMSVQEGKSPGVNVSPLGAASTASGGGGAYESGGFKWSWLDCIWAAIKRAAWLGLISLVGLVVLLAVPATRPAGILILRVIGWILPVVGGVIETIRGKIFRRQRDQIIEGGEAFKQAAKEALPPKVFLRVKELFQSRQQASQDRGTQRVVKAQTR